MIITFFNLLVIFQVKHLVCDYFLQGKYMLGKFNPTGWALPLAAHCAVHAVATASIALYYAPSYALPLAIADFFIHFVIDKFKVEASRGYDSQKDKEFWIALGMDQFAHHMTHYMLIAMMMHLMYGNLN